MPNIIDFLPPEDAQYVTPVGSSSGGQVVYGAGTLNAGDILSAVNTVASSPNLVTAPSPSTSAAPSTGGGGGYGSGGGGTGSVPPPTSPSPSSGPTTTDADTGTEPVSDIEQLSEEQLAAAIAAIEAEFGLTQSQLEADRTELGARYRMLRQQLANARRSAIEENQLSFEGRGLLRSGQRLRSDAELLQQFALQQAGLAQEQAAQQASVEAQLAALGGQQENAIAQAVLEAEAGQLDFETLMAMIQAGLA